VKVHDLPSSGVPSWLVPLLGSVLILAREEVVAALLGLMVELRGLHPRFLSREESVQDVIERGSLAAVVIDCDHPDCNDGLLQAIRKTGAVPILFSPFRMQSEVREVAARHGTRSFTLPTDPDTFGRMLEA
jgi:DNA-binding NtrC family response regulator